MKTKRDQVENQTLKTATVGNTVQVGFRLPEWLVVYIDSLAEAASKKAGRSITRTDMATLLLVKGLGYEEVLKSMEGDVARALSTLAQCAEAAAQNPEDMNRLSLAQAMEQVFKTQAALAWTRDKRSELPDAGIFTVKVEDTASLGNATSTTKLERI